MLPWAWSRSHRMIKNVWTLSILYLRKTLLPEQHYWELLVQTILVWAWIIYQPLSWELQYSACIWIHSNKSNFMVYSIHIFNHSLKTYFFFSHQKVLSSHKIMSQALEIPQNNNYIESHIMLKFLSILLSFNALIFNAR